MAYTFLNGVNAVLKRAQVIQGDSGALTTFTDSGRQHWVDNVIQIWNEAVRQLLIRNAINGEVKEGTVTLVSDSGARTEYSLPSDFEQFTGDDKRNTVFVCQTVNHVVTPYPGGYIRMYRDQPKPANFTGRPNYFAINPVTGKIRFDTNPQDGQAGEIYTYLYDKRINLSATTDTFPFSDTVVDELVPAVAEIFRQDKDGRPRTPIYATMAFNTAMQIARQMRPRSHYGVEYIRARHVSLDPLEP